MYVRHPPHEHADWLARKKAGQKYVPPDYRTNMKSGEDQPPPNKPNDIVSEPKKLALTEMLKSVLCGQLFLSDEDVNHVCNTVFEDK